MINEDVIEEYLDMVCERWTAEELVELLGLSARDICEQFREEVLDSRNVREALDD